MKTPEEVARDRIAQLDMSGSLTDALTSGWFNGDDVERWLAEAIEADRAQRSYVATVQVGGYDPHRMTVTPAPGQSIVDALIEQGDGSVQDEWSLVDVEAVRA